MTWQTKVHGVQGADSLVIESGGSIEMKNGSVMKAGTIVGPTMSPPAGITINSRPRLSHTFSTPSAQTYTLNFTDNGTNGGNASINLGLTPTGVYLVEYVLVAGTLTAVSGLTSTAAVVASIGTVAASNANATLTSTEADIIASTTCTLSAGVGILNLTAVTQVLLDTSVSGGLFVNFAVPDAGITADAVATLLAGFRFVLTRLD